MDYRRATFSSQIISGQLTREEALEELKSLPYSSQNITKDKEYISKKYRITLNQLEEYLSAPPKTYRDFPNSKNKIEWFYNQYRKLFN